MVLQPPIRHTHDMRRAAIPTLLKLKSLKADVSSFCLSRVLSCRHLIAKLQSAMGGHDEHDLYLVSP
jgi:hypothetical protein